MDTTYRPSLLSDSSRERWRSPTLALALHATVATAFAITTMKAPAVEQEPVIVIELAHIQAPSVEPTVEPPTPAAAPLPKPLPPAPAPKLAVKTAAPLPALTAPSPSAQSSSSHEAVAEAPAAASSPGPATNAPATASQDAGYIPPSSSAAYLSNPKPHYPPMARRKGWEGIVRLLVQVDENGQPVSVSVAQSSGYSMLDHCAQAAVQQWRFTPAKRGGQQVAASVEVPIRFNLSDS